MLLGVSSQDRVILKQCRCTARRLRLNGLDRWVNYLNSIGSIQGSEGRPLRHTLPAAGFDDLRVEVVSK